jgi:exopolyphosphatase / guanosine-5'-triphosphate,3'-diphosphate pyrophosphatase
VAEIVPRWEWRTFDADLGPAARSLAELTPDQVVESSELYVVPAAGGDVVKVRDGLMDVKHLHTVDADGLEQWSPVMKAPFPVSRADVESVLEALGVRATATLAGSTYSLAELLAEVVAPHPALRAVEVHKNRRRFTLGGCMAELTDVNTEHGSTRTIAVESESAERVVAEVGRLGLFPRPNVNYGRALRVLARFGVERCAVVDVGTNSVKFHIGERGADGSWTTVVDRAEVTRLGDGLDESGRLNPEPIARTATAVAGMVEEAKAERVAAIAAVGTAGLRIAPNGQDFVDDVQQRCGIQVEVISGEDEARLAYLAAVAGLGLTGHGSRVVFDTGGGSSQFSFGDGDDVHERFSVEVGAVRFTEAFALDGPVSPDVVSTALGSIEGDLGRLNGRETPETLVGMGGGLTNLAAVRHGLSTYDPDVVQGTVLDRAEIDRQIELYRTRTADERREVVGLQPQRAEVILAGACIVRTVLTMLGKDSLTVSDRGLRYGVLSERFG